MSRESSSQVKQGTEEQEEGLICSATGCIAVWERLRVGGHKPVECLDTADLQWQWQVSAGVKKTGFPARCFKHEFNSCPNPSTGGSKLTGLKLLLYVTASPHPSL